MKPVEENLLGTLCVRTLNDWKIGSLKPGSETGAKEASSGSWSGLVTTKEVKEVTKLFCRAKFRAFSLSSVVLVVEEAASIFLMSCLMWRKACSFWRNCCAWLLGGNEEGGKHLSEPGRIPGRTDRLSELSTLSVLLELSVLLALSA
jgi:hypothetical protein